MYRPPVPAVPPSAARRFTLIELLVVVSIISLLAAMLLPALQTARKKAKESLCASYLKQHGTAHASYAGDYEGYFPAFGGTPYNYYSDWIGTTVAVASGSLWQIDDGYTTMTYLKHYAGCTTTYDGQQLFRCPVLVWSLGKGWTSPTPWTYNNAQWALPLPNSRPGIGYNFYPGEKFYAPGSAAGYDTCNRRENPYELLATDILSRHNATGASGGFSWSAASPYFNPHNGPATRPVKDGTFNQLTADGAVGKYDYARTSTTTSHQNDYAYAYAKSVAITNAPDDGLYYVAK